MKIAESELLGRGSISKTLLVQTFLSFVRAKKTAFKRVPVLHLPVLLEAILSKKLDPMMKKLEIFTDVIGNLKSRVDQLQEECAKLRRMKAFEGEDLCREATERLHRRKYLILSRIPEQVCGSVTAREETDIEGLRRWLRLLTLTTSNQLRCPGHVAHE